jgi:hypothetical protein
MKKVFIFTFILSFLLNTSVCAADIENAETLLETNSICEELMQQTEAFCYSSNQSASMQAILSEENPSFFKIVKVLSESPLYDSFTNLSDLEFQKLLKLCSKEERYVLYGMFYYGTLDYLSEHSIDEEHLEDFADTISSVSKTIQKYPDAKSNDGTLLLIRILNLQHNQKKEYKNLSSYVADKSKNYDGEKILSAIMSNTSKEKLIEIFSSVFLKNRTSESTESTDSQKVESESASDSKDLTIYSEKKANGQAIKSQSAKDYTATKIGENKTYKSGTIKIIITDENSGKTTTGTLKVSRKNAISLDNMCDSSSTWNCSLTVDEPNYHNLSMEQTSVSTVKDVYGNYLVMNFKLTITQHSYYIYKNQTHAGSGNGFRLNFESYTQMNTGAGTIIDGIVESDTTRNINWQVNTAAIGLKTINKVRYTNCKSYLNYWRPAHTVTVKPNGGTYAGKTSNTIYQANTGDWVNLFETPYRTGYLFDGFQCSGSSYIYRSSGSGMSNDTSSGTTAQYYSSGFTRYTCTKPSLHTSNSIRMNTFSAPKNHPIRITGWIRINSLPSDQSIDLFVKNGATKNGKPGASMNGANGEWKKFDLSQTFSSATDQAYLELCFSSCSQVVQFDLKNIIITDMTTKKRLGDTNIQVSDGKTSDITLTARWIPLRYKIVYSAGLSNASGSTEEQIQNQDQTLALNKNGFSISHAQFVGWKYGNQIYQPNAIISYQDLASQTLQQRKIDADIIPDTIEEEDTFTLTAVWNYYPAITISNSNATYVEGESVRIDSLLKYIEKCTDPEDNNLLLTPYVKEISYSRAKDGYQPTTQTSFNHDSLLDTYFMHLQENETVKALVTFGVIDSNGEETTASKYIQIIYNYPPTLTAYNLSFYQDEILTTPENVTKQIQENMTVSDFEDDRWNRKLSSKITSPNPLDVSKMSSLGTHSVTYYVKDSLGKETTKTVSIYVANSNPYATQRKRSVRFISKDYLHTLSSDSIWKKKSAYYTYLTNSLNQSESASGDIYTFTIGE